jgi:hypothetical protein
LNIDDINYVREFAKKYEAMMNERNDADYQINPKNWIKLLTVLEYLETEVARLDGKLEPVRLIPKEQHGYVQAIFDIFDVYGENLKVFTHVLKLADVFFIDALTNGKIRIGLNINDVYVKK